MTPPVTALGSTLDALATGASNYAQPPTHSYRPGPVLDLSVGEVRYLMPPAVRTEAAAALESLGSWGYCDPRGDTGLKEAYLRHLGDSTMRGRAGGLAGSHDLGVVVTAGGKEACWLALQHAVHHLEVHVALIPRPGWEPYALWLRASGCDVAFYDPIALAKDPSVLAGILAQPGNRIRLLILNYPNNPTGICLSQQGMDQIMATAAEADVAVISDEVYRAFAPETVSALHAAAFRTNCDAVVDSTSKSLASAGLRVGFLVGGRRLLADVTAFRSTYASCTSIVTQKLAATLLNSPEAASWLSAVRTHVNDNTALLAGELTERGVQVTSHGGLYLWCRTGTNREQSPAPVTVRMTPGAGFGVADHVRICAATEGLLISRVADCITNALATHPPGVKPEAVEAVSGGGGA